MRQAIKQFWLGVAAGVMAQAIVGIVQWLRAPALRGRDGDGGQ